MTSAKMLTMPMTDRALLPMSVRLPLRFATGEATVARMPDDPLDSGKPREGLARGLRAVLIWTPIGLPAVGLHYVVWDATDSYWLGYLRVGAARRGDAMARASGVLPPSGHADHRDRVAIHGGSDRVANGVAAAPELGAPDGRGAPIPLASQPALCRLLVDLPQPVTVAAEEVTGPRAIHTHIPLVGRPPLHPDQKRGAPRLRLRICSTLRSASCREYEPSAERGMAASASSPRRRTGA